MRPIGWIASAALALTSTAAIAVQSYSITDLGITGSNSPDFINTLRPYGVNNMGQVVGAIPLGYFLPTHAFLYSDGHMVDLGTLGGETSSANGINNSGQVVGTSRTAYNSGDTLAFRYVGGRMEGLGTLGGTSSSGYGINDRGEIVGQAATATSPGHAFLYSDGQMKDLGTLGGTLSAAMAVNEAGQIVGWADTLQGVTRAFLYSNNSMRDLGTLGGAFSEANAINNSGQIVGRSNTSGNASTHAFIYTNGQMIDIGALGGRHSTATDINNRGEVVGIASIDQPVDLFERPFLYAEGQTFDLNSLIDPLSGWKLHAAFSINDLGQIAATGIGPEGYRALLLSPVAEPSSGLMLFAGIILLVAIGRRPYPTMQC